MSEGSSDNSLNKRSNKTTERSAKMPKMDAQQQLSVVCEAGDDATKMMAFTEGSRRTKEKQAFAELSALVPLAPPIRDQLDKTGTLRVSIAFLKLQRLFATFNNCSSDDDFHLVVANAENVGKCNDQSSTTTAAGVDQIGQRHHHQYWQNANATGFYGLGPSKNYCSTNAKDGSRDMCEELIMHQFAYNLFQAMDGFVIVLDGDGKVTYSSETVAVHLGLAQVELAGIALADFLHSDDAVLLRDVLALHLPARAFRVLHPELRFTLRFRCMPGRRAMMGCNGIGMLAGFKPIHFVGTLHAHDDGRFLGYGQPSVPYGLNELRLCSSMFMFRATPALQLIFVEKRFTELTEFLPDFLLNKSLYSLIHPDDVQQLCEGYSPPTVRRQKVREILDEWHFVGSSPAGIIAKNTLDRDCGKVHQSALRGGHALSAFLRFLNARGGWHWVQCRLCTTSSSRLPSLAKMVIGVCTIISNVELFSAVLDELQLNTRKSNNNNSLSNSSSASGDTMPRNDNGTGVLGYYSNKFYANGTAPAAAAAAVDKADTNQH